MLAASKKATEEEARRRVLEERVRTLAEAHEALEVAKSAEAHEALEVAKRQCSPITLAYAPRKTGRKRKSEEEKAAAAEKGKLRRQREDDGASARRDKPSAELQLRIRAQVLGAPDAKSKFSASFWTSEADM